jgi:hypothetical protein
MRFTDQLRNAASNLIIPCSKDYALAMEAAADDRRLQSAAQTCPAMQLALLSTNKANSWPPCSRICTRVTGKALLPGLAVASADTADTDSLWGATGC